ncbi:MAG TPA: EAL domain-containing protein [Tepidisphaeraceae bacterium]
MNHSNIFSAALDQALDAILITDADLNEPGPRILYANASFCRLTGYSLAELLGRSPRMLQGNKTARPILDSLREKLRTGQPFVGSTTNYRRDGTAFEIEWHVSPVFSKDGKVCQYMSVHRDVTAAKHFQKSISDYVKLLLDQQRAASARQVELETANAHLKALAVTDGLTGTFNHRYFHEELSRISKQAGPVSLLMVDVDHFKSFNDAFGHPAGDTVLQKVAQVVQMAAGKGNVVARYGGEEFAVLMPGSDADSSLALAERIRREVESASVPQRGITVSIGVSTLVGGESVGRALLEQADAALYAAKSAGRNRMAHHRHAKLKTRSAATATACKTQCAPSPTGCLKCESIPAMPGASPSMLFGPQDADAHNTLIEVLAEGNFEYKTTGPLLILSDIRSRLAEIGTLLKNKLSPITQANITAAYVPGGLASSEQIMRALLVARPLTELIDNLEHEWIREALSDGWLFSVFHPILHARNGELFAQEALLRARNPVTQQILGAGQIINACEKLNLQHQLDQRARQAAIRGAAEHVSPESKVFINFLPNTIYDPAICLRTTMEAAAEYKVSMDRLVFEVVETEKIPDMAHLHKILEYYRERGVGTAIDDMGAGFTGVDYITSLKPDFVKLDREFVLTAEETSAGHAQLERIVGVAHEYGSRVIAEGIETEAQMNLCVNAGIDFLQGFLFAKPACPPQAVRFPSQQRRVA